jgi:hypothetical protein
VLGLALALTALLAVVAAVSWAHRSPGGEAGEGGSARLSDYLLSAYLVLGALAALAIVVLVVTRQLPQGRQRNRRQRRQLISFLVVMMALAVLPTVSPAIRDLLERIRDLGPGSRQTTTTGRPGARRGPREVPLRPEREREFRWAAALGVVVLAGGGVAAYFVTRPARRRPGGKDTLAEALADVLDDALADLRAERDPRRAIIAAYARMERLLAAHGVPRRPSEAPFEYLARVLTELRASSGSVFELTALFERAKFSQHEVDARMKDEAVEALASVRDELKEAA